MKFIYQFSEPDRDALYTSLRKAYKAAKASGLKMPMFGYLQSEVENKSVWFHYKADYSIQKRMVH